MEQLVTIGLIAVFAGIALIIIGTLAGAGRGEAKVAVVGFIGPVPFGFANDKPLFYAAIAIAVTLLVVSIFLGQKLL